MPEGNKGSIPRTRFEIAHLQIQESLSKIRKALGIELKLNQGQPEQPVERTIKDQVSNHIDVIENLANNVDNLASDVQAMRKDLLASPGPGSFNPGQ